MVILFCYDIAKRERKKVRIPPKAVYGVTRRRKYSKNKGGTGYQSILRVATTLICFGEATLAVSFYNPSVIFPRKMPPPFTQEEAWF